MGQRAPWTDEQVAAIQSWQADHCFHGLTCVYHGDRPLTVSRDGLSCGMPTCSYRQDWVPSLLARSRVAS